MWDVDGNEWVDYPMALGPVLLGYAEPVVDDPVKPPLPRAGCDPARPPQEGGR